jgi:hypothetical protein
VINKYHSKKVECDGIVFDSKKEAKRYRELKLLEKAGQIRGLRLQVPFVLIPAQRDASGKVIERAVTYRADFVYTNLCPYETVIEDTKGIKTKEYIIKRKLMMYIHKIRIKEV